MNESGGLCINTIDTKSWIHDQIIFEKRLKRVIYLRKLENALENGRFRIIRF